METLGTSGTKIDLNHLDSITTLFFNSGAPPELNQLLDNFVNRDDLYIYSEEVLMSECNPSSKFFFLLGLTKLISSRWMIIPDEDKSNTRETLVNFISQPYDSNLQAVLTKAYAALSEILKFDLDQEWPDFFEAFFSFTSSSPINGLHFLSYFANEIMSDSEQVMTSNRASELMTICTNQLDDILEFVYSILQENLNDKLLIKTILPVFSILVTWISPTKVFQSPIFDLITNSFINEQEYALESCEVLMEFLRTTSPFPELVGNISQIFFMIIETLYNLCDGDYLSLPYRIHNMFLNMMDKCLTGFTAIFNQDETQESLQYAYEWLMKLTVERFDESIYNESMQEMCYSVWMNSYNKLLQGKVYQATQDALDEFMAPLRRAIIENFPQPYKIVTYIDDFNNETHIFQNQQFSTNLCNLVRDCFLFLTNVDTDDTIDAINERFDQEDELTVEDIQRLGFSIAATAGAFEQQIENTVVFEIIQRYFSLCESDNPNIDSTERGRMKVASGLIYMCSQYFSLLNRFNPLLKAVLQLILKFLIEGDFELQAVSINALKNLSQHCKRMVAFPQSKDDESFLNQLLDSSEQIFETMDPDNIVELFRVFAIMIRAHDDEQTKINYLQQLMSGIDKMWDEVVMSSSFDPFDVQQLRIIELTLMCHSSILISLSSTYANILKDFIPQLISVMQILSQAMPDAESEDILNSIKSAKSQIFSILFKFNYFCYKQDLILDMIIPASFQPILDDYLNSEPQFRLRSSLKYFTAIFNRCAGAINDMVFDAYDLIVEATLPTISDNYIDFIEVRTEFFNLTASIIHQYSHILSTKEPEYLDSLIKMLKFGAEHTTQQICENCIELISELFLSFKKEMSPPDRFEEFFDLYYIEIVQLYFQLLTDLTYKFAFQQETMSIKNLFIIDNMKTKTPDVLSLLCEMYPTVSPSDVSDLIQSLIDSQSFVASKIKLRDFILLVKVVMPNDPDIYKDEIMKLREDLNKPFKEYISVQNSRDEDTDEAEQQITQDLKVAPSPQLIDELASLSIRH